MTEDEWKNPKRRSFGIYPRWRENGARARWSFSSMPAVMS